MLASCQIAPLLSCLTTSFSTRAVHSACRQPAPVSVRSEHRPEDTLRRPTAMVAFRRFTGQCGFANLILEGPRFVRSDMSLVKKIHFSEKTNMEFRVEVLNAFNNINFLVGGSAAVDDGKLTATNLGLQTPNYSGAAFGTITAAYQDISTTNDPGGRPVQFVFRFNF